MRALMLLSVFLCVPPALAASPAETLERFHEALAAGQREQAAALLSPSIRIYESGGAERSRDEYLQHHLYSDIAFARATRNRILQQSERIEGAFAMVLRESETTGTFRRRRVHLFGTETAVLERQGEQWVIVHLHWSSRKVK